MKMIGRATSKKEMEDLEEGLPPFVVVRVSPVLLTNTFGHKYVDEGGMELWLDSVNFYASGEHGIEAEPVLSTAMPRG